jgi:tripartite-type tricarboxylate transporter receptor subunit TctC
MKKASLLAILGLLCTFIFQSAQAQARDYPDKPLRLVVAYAPGGATDIVARMLAQELSQILGQSVIVENKAGGGTLVGSDSVRRAPSDGYTLLFGTNAFIITPLLHNSPTYDPIKDFSHVSFTTIQPLALLVSPSLKIQTVDQLLKYARENPGKINFASSGNGSAQHLAGEAFRNAAKIDMTHVPYKGAGPALIDLLAGRVDIMFTSLVGNTDHIKHERLIMLATTGERRGVATPNTPSLAEFLSGYQAYTWQGVIAPANTPEAIITKLNAAIKKATAIPAFYEKLNAQGMEVQTSSPQEMRTRLAAESLEYQTLLSKTQTSIK